MPANRHHVNTYTLPEAVELVVLENTRGQLGTWGACPMLDPEFDTDDYEVALDMASTTGDCLTWTR